VPPLTILRGGTGEWTHTDRVLAVAHVLAQNMLCETCGQPKHEALNPDSDGYYEVREALCQGCAAIDRDREKNADDTRDRMERKLAVIDTRPPDEPLRPFQPFAD
jgi:MinD superfamily P-loop ATPase